MGKEDWSTTLPATSGQSEKGKDTEQGGRGLGDQGAIELDFGETVEVVVPAMIGIDLEFDEASQKRGEAIEDLAAVSRESRRLGKVGDPGTLEPRSASTP